MGRQIGLLHRYRIWAVEMLMCTLAVIGNRGYTKSNFLRNNSAVGLVPTLSQWFLFYTGTGSGNNRPCSISWASGT